MMGREHAAWVCHVALVIGDGSMAYDDTTDVEVEWSMLGGILGSQRIEYKLDVERTLVILLVKVGIQAKQLGRRDGDLSILQRENIHLGR